MRFDEIWERSAICGAYSWKTPHILAVGDKKVSGVGMYAEKDFPEMFTLDMVKGSREALKDPSTCLIARSMALGAFWPGKTR